DFASQREGAAGDECIYRGLGGIGKGQRSEVRGWIAEVRPHRLTMFSIGFITDPLMKADLSEERVGPYANLSRSSWSLICAGRRELASNSCRSLVGISRLNSRARARERCSVRRSAARISLRQDHFGCCATACSRAALAAGRSTELMTRASVRRG